LKSKPPETPIFFVDRSLGKKFIADAFRSANARIEIHDDHFPQSVNDVYWLRVVGSRGWIVLTKDEKIRTRNSELQAVKNHSVGMFVLTAGNITGPAMASIFVSALPRMIRFIRGNKKPFIAVISRHGRIRKVRT